MRPTVFRASSDRTSKRRTDTRVGGRGFEKSDKVVSHGQPTAHNSISISVIYLHFLMTQDELMSDLVFSPLQPVWPQRDPTPSSESSGAAIPDNNRDSMQPSISMHVYLEARHAAIGDICPLQVTIHAGGGQ